MGFGGEFRVRLREARTLDWLREEHPDWDRARLLAESAEVDTGWQKNVVTDFGRRFLVVSSWASALALFVHRGTSPGNVRRNSLQFIYLNQTPSMARVPDTQVNDTALLLQTRTVEYTPPPHQAGTGDSISGGPVTWTLSDTTGAPGTFGVFTPEMVGNTITITGAGIGANNGTFPVTAYISPTQIQYTNAAGAAETSAFSWDIGVTRTIAMVGLTNSSGNVSNAINGNREIIGVLAYTVLSSPVIQSASQVADVQYRVTWSLD